MSSPFHCSSVIRECSWNKTQIEKKNVSKKSFTYKGLTLYKHLNHVLVKFTNLKIIPICKNIIKMLRWRNPLRNQCLLCICPCQPYEAMFPSSVHTKWLLMNFPGTSQPFETPSSLKKLSKRLVLSLSEK